MKRLIFSIAIATLGILAYASSNQPPSVDTAQATSTTSLVIVTSTIITNAAASTTNPVFCVWNSGEGNYARLTVPTIIASGSTIAVTVTGTRVSLDTYILNQFGDLTPKVVVKSNSCN